MKIKKEYIILAAIILALSLYLSLRNPDRTQYNLPNLPVLFRMDISKIEISKQDTSILMNMKDNKWFVGTQGYPANAEKIEKILNIIEKFPITALVSESKNYEPYDLDKDKKTTIKAWIGDTLSREFEIGKTTDSYRHTFVKLGGDYRVYQITGDLVAIFNQTIDTLRDKTIFSFDPDKIQEIQITKSQDSITLTRKETPVKPAGDQEVDEQTTETIWLSADGQEPDKLNVASLVNRLSKLFCQAYIYDRTKEDFKNPIYTIKLIGKKEYTLSIFDKTNETAKDSPAVASESNYPFLFNSWLATQITENLDALLNTSGTT